MRCLRGTGEARGAARAHRSKRGKRSTAPRVTTMLPGVLRFGGWLLQRSRCQIAQVHHARLDHWGRGLALSNSGDQDSLAVEGRVDGRGLYRGPDEPMATSKALHDPDIPSCLSGPCTDSFGINFGWERSQLVQLGHRDLGGNSMARSQLRKSFSKARSGDPKAVFVFGPGNAGLARHLQRRPESVSTTRTQPYNGKSVQHGAVHPSGSDINLVMATKP